MPYRQLRETGQALTRVHADVCVIGAGIAGLIAAVRLARSQQLRVVVVESGVGKDDMAAGLFDQIDNPSPNYQGAMRARGLGGTSARWCGKLLPLSASDLEARPWVDVPSWPFGFDELYRYRVEIERMMRVDAGSSESDAGAWLDVHGLLPASDAEFATRWPKLPSAARHDLVHVLRAELETRTNLTIWLGATVTGFRFTPEQRVAEITATNLTGQTVSIHAREYLIAAGTLESTRLMLVADRQSGGAVSRTTDRLGRHFNDHLALHVAQLQPRPRVRRHVNRMLADRWLTGAARHLHFELRPHVQQRHRVGSSYFDFALEMAHDSALSQRRLATHALRRGQLLSAAAHTKLLLSDLPSLWSTLHWRLLDKQQCWPADASVYAKVWIEQLPLHRNRIVLSEKCDALGQPLIAVEFHRTQFEERSLRTCVDRLKAFWSRHRLSEQCALEWAEGSFAADGSSVQAATEQAHPAGSTRMGNDPKTSVVDAHLRVHAMPNLSIASAAVFPSSGSANPTFTIMQLALRAAEAIETKLEKQRRSVPCAVVMPLPAAADAPLSARAR
ncbi:MAG: hypothetical protein RL701_3121 [Pseudomonadota bacterium]